MLEAHGRSVLEGCASRTGVIPIYPYNLLIISLFLTENRAAEPISTARFSIHIPESFAGCPKFLNDA